MNDRLTLSPDAAAAAFDRFVKKPSPGAPPPHIELFDENGRMLNIADDPFVGGYTVALLVHDLSSDAGRTLVSSFARLASSFDAERAKVVVICGDSDCARNRAEKAAIGAPFPILADVSGGAFAAFGLNRWRGAEGGPAARTVVITPYRQIRASFDAPGDPSHAERALDMVRDARLADAVSWTAPHAPVLAVPQALSPDECRALIQRYETVGPVVASKADAKSTTGDYKIPVYEYGRQDRTDHIIKDPSVLAFLDQRLFERVIPEIRKCFAFQVTQREFLHIARYEGRRGGMQMGHRDNRTDTFHRRFALSLNLNDDYEGGAVAFREYGGRGYKSPAGTALVFSSELLHEVEETTRGVRYTLISHFFNEASLAEAKSRGPQRT